MKFYTVSEVAYEMIYSGRLKAIQLSKRRIRIPETSINEFINK
ncbi:helix-turn-helix domain-containing protein [Desulfolucanica intricata]|nr:helix-turn-helix domain-containing protein [Desulfolucanica intricata]